MDTVSDITGARWRIQKYNHGWSFEDWTRCLENGSDKIKFEYYIENLFTHSTSDEHLQSHIFNSIRMDGFYVSYWIVVSVQIYLGKRSVTNNPMCAGLIWKFGQDKGLEFHVSNSRAIFVRNTVSAESLMKGGQHKERRLVRQDPSPKEGSDSKRISAYSLEGKSECNTCGVTTSDRFWRSQSQTDQWIHDVSKFRLSKMLQGEIITNLSSSIFIFKQSAVNGRIILARWTNLWSEETKDIIMEQDGIETFELIELTHKVQFKKCHKYMSIDILLSLWVSSSRSQWRSA